MTVTIGRRELLAALGGAAAAWSGAARAQQPERVRRVGVLMNIAVDDAQAQSRMEAFLHGLQPLGWTVGRNLQIDARWAAADAGLFRKYATELVALEPDVILACTNSAVAPLQQATRTVPIVFTITVDPVGAGFVASLARPGGNTTGFFAVRIQHQREMARTAQTDRAGRDASGGPSGPRNRIRDRPVRSNPGRGPTFWGGCVWRP